MENWPIGTRQRRSTFAVAAELIEQGLLHPEKLLTHRFALTNFREAIRAAKSKGETRAIKVVFDYALLPASVVPNVRSSARKQRPARVTTATWPEQEEEQAQPVAESEPVGNNWMQEVQPFPPVTPAAPEPVIEPERAQDDGLLTPLATGEVEPTPYATEEGVAHQGPMDETMLFYTFEEDAPAMPELTGEEVTARIPARDAQEQYEPQPIVLPHEEPADTGATPEDELEVETQRFPKPVLERKRTKPSGRKTEDQSSATKDAPETL